MVSGTISLFCPKCFSPFPHGTGSLSVSREYLALPDGPGGFTQDSSCPALLRIPLCFATLRVRACHPLRTDFPDGSAHDALATARSYNPEGASTPAVWALPRSLATTGGIISYFLFLRVLRCFSSPRYPRRTYAGDSHLRWLGCPIRRSRDQGPFAPTPRFSQLITSFIASWSQGIRHAPFPTFLFSLDFPLRAGIHTGAARAHTSGTDRRVLILCIAIRLL